MVIKVAVNGACGNMGQEVCRSVLKEDGLKLVGAVDMKNTGKSLGDLLGEKELRVTITNNLHLLLDSGGIDVMVDFTSPLSVLSNIETSLKSGVRLVVGTTGITEAELETVAGWTERYNTPAIIAPNFALGAVLMIEFAAKAARFFPDVEIIERHHDQKIDAPSGTALKTASDIIKNRISEQKEGNPVQEVEKLPGARGAETNGIHIHSVRLPGLIAHQEVIFGAAGQILTIKHDSLNRKSFMPGVMLAIKRVMDLRGLVYGLENIIDL